MALSRSHNHSFLYFSLFLLAARKRSPFGFRSFSSVSLRRQPKKGVSLCACAVTSTIVKIRTNVNKQVKINLCQNRTLKYLDIFNYTDILKVTFCEILCNKFASGVSTLFVFFRMPVWSRQPALILSSRIVYKFLMLIKICDNTYCTDGLTVGYHCVFVIKICRYSKDVSKE